MDNDGKRSLASLHWDESPKKENKDHCMECERRQKEIDNLELDYSILSDDYVELLEDIKWLRHQLGKE
jgi:hypothetical protein